MATSGSLTPWSARNRSTPCGLQPDTPLDRLLAGEWQADRGPEIWRADRGPEIWRGLRLEPEQRAELEQPEPLGTQLSPRQHLDVIGLRLPRAPGGPQPVEPVLDVTDLVQALGETAQVGLLDLHLELEHTAGAPSPHGQRTSVQPVALDPCADAPGLRQEQFLDGPRVGEGDRWVWRACPQQARGVRIADAEALEVQILDPASQVLAGIGVQVPAPPQRVAVMCGNDLGDLPALGRQPGRVEEVTEIGPVWTRRRWRSAAQYGSPWRRLRSRCSAPRS
jgi:hypothetical protein